MSWFILDAWGAFASTAGIAYWAHVGGFIVGFVLGFIFLHRGWAIMASYDNPTLLDHAGIKVRTQVPAVAGVPETRPLRAKTPKATIRERLKPELPGAKQSVPVPVVADANINCPTCGQNMDVPASMFGKPFKCPSCGERLCVDD